MDSSVLLQSALAGDRDSLGQLLEDQRDYLRLLARVEIGRQLQGKVEASDVVQDAFADAHRQFTAFRGSTVPQFSQWLRTILAGMLANTIRRYLGTQARDPQLEQSLVQRLDFSAVSLAGLLVDPHSSPSQQLVRREDQSAIVASLERLPADYRAVLELRHLEGLTFPAIAERLKRTSDSVEKLWLRGITRLRAEFRDSQP